MPLEWWPDDGGRKNRGLVWKAFKEADKMPHWYGPRTNEMNPTQNPSTDLLRRFVRIGKMPAPQPFQLQKESPTLKETRDDPTGARGTLGQVHQGLMWITPEQYEDDVNAFLYYGSIGLLDPKNPADALAYSKAFGWPYSVSLGVAIIGGFFFWGTLGWFFDPQDKREEVGGWRSDWYDKWMNPDNYTLPEGF
jgi:hypothetical protein